jgi:LmbE family N-acetylglucosaminyl deacetylase
MKKLLFGIFAHPDDEAFGPSGTLLRESRNGTELHLITLTAGENGMNPDNHPNLADVRLAEWQSTGKLLGATSMHYLGFTDGTLDNISMLRAVTMIEKVIQDTVDAHDKPLEVELMSMDTTGITGHIDHIVASRAAHHVFYNLKQAGMPLTRLRLVCIPRSQTGDAANYDFVFMEPGRLPREIDETVDNRQYIAEVHAIIRTHHSQRSDGEAHIKKHGDNVAIDFFIHKT